MIQILAPDGSVAEFPDGTPDAEIERAMRSAYGGPQQSQERGAVDKLTGQGGPRHQTWPERLLRGIASGVSSGVNLPGDVMADAMRQRDTLSDSDVSPLSVPRALEAATLALPVNPSVRMGDRGIPAARPVQGPYATQTVERSAPGAPPTLEMAPTTEYRPVLDLARSQPKPPAADELLKRGGRQIDEAAGIGVEFSPQAVKELGQSLEVELLNKGADDTFAKETFGIVRKLSNHPEGTVSSTFGNVKTLREALGKAAQSTDGRERRAASIAIDWLDNWLSSPPAGALLDRSAAGQGNAAVAAELYKTGRGNYAAGKRSDDITGRADAAELRAAAANSGRNIDNATRQRFVDLLISDKAGRGYTKEELDAVERLVRGTKGMNASRYVGNLLGGGGGMGQALTTMGSAAIGAAGGAMGGGLYGAGVGAAAGTALPLTIGALAKSLSGALTKNQARKIDEMTRKRSPLFREMEETAPMVAQGVNKREALIRALLMGVLGQQ